MNALTCKGDTNDKATYLGFFEDKSGVLWFPSYIGEIISCSRVACVWFYNGVVFFQNRIWKLLWFLNFSFFWLSVTRNAFVMIMQHGFFIKSIL